MQFAPKVYKHDWWENEDQLLLITGGTVDYISADQLKIKVDTDFYNFGKSGMSKIPDPLYIGCNLKVSEKSKLSSLKRKDLVNIIGRLKNKFSPVIEIDECEFEFFNKDK